MDLGGKMALHAGDVTGDERVLYSNLGNDRAPILQLIGGVNITNVVNNYYGGEDVNMDGSVLYSNVNNDRAIILQKIGGVNITNTLEGQVP